MKLPPSCARTLDRRSWMPLLRLLSLLLLLPRSFGLLFALPTLQRQPTDTSVIAGQNATFTVVATSGSGPLSYQWRRAGMPIPGATNATLVLGRVTRGDAGFFDVAVTDATGQVSSPAVRLDVATRREPALLAADPATDLMTEKLGASLRAVAPLPDGGFLVAGSFTTINNARRSLVARFTAAGVLDATFVPSEIAGSSVSALAVQRDGKVVIGGSFDRVGYFARNGLARLNADGSLDLTFVPTLPTPSSVSSVLILPDGKVLVAAWPLSVLLRLNSDGTLDRDLSNRAGGGVNAMALQRDGNVVIVGPNVGGGGRAAMRLTRDGNVDPEFVPPTYNGVLQTVLITSDGGILIGGGAVFGATAPPVMKLTATGAADPAFTPPTGNGSVYALAELPEGRILAGGTFDQINGMTRRNLVRLSRTGVPDNALISPSYTVSALGVLASGAAIVTGTSSGSAASPVLSRYTSNGTLDTTWSHTFRSAGQNTAIVQLVGGKFLVLGQFDMVRGRAARNVVRLNADGTLDATLDTANYRTQPFDRIVSAAPLGDGGAVIAGLFTFNPGSLTTPLAILDAAGVPDPAFSPRTSAVAYPESVAVLPDGRIAVAGFVNLDNGSLASPGAVAVYNRDGTLDSTFAQGGRFAGGVRSVAVQRDGAMIVGGWMSAFNGRAVTPLVRLNHDGSLERSFATTGIFTSIVQVRVLADGKVLATGFQPSGQLALVRFNADGTFDTSFRIATSGDPTRFIVQENGKVLALSQTSRSGPSAFVRYDADGSVDTSFRIAGALPVNDYTVPAFFLTDDGNLLFVNGRNGPVQLGVATSAPTIVTPPAPQVVQPGGSATLSVVASSMVPVSYQWYFNGQPIAGATNATHAVSDFQPLRAGNYRVAITSDLGTTQSAAVAVSAPADTRGRLVNLSVRGNAAAGDSRLIVGLVMGGSNPGVVRPLLFRGVGPTLASFGIGNAQPDPVLEVYDPTGFKIDQNDDWAGVFDFASIGSFPFSGSAPKDAAIYNPFATAGAQTFHVVGKGAASGVVLAEVYDAAPEQPFTLFTPRIINLSVRTVVGTGDDVLIVGLVITGETSQRLLIRAIGPTLAAAPFSLGGTLSDPRLELYNSARVNVAENDNWGDNAAQMTTVFRATGAFPLVSESSKDAALLATLAPGSYTAVVRGVGSTTGIALVELYEVP